MNAVPSAGSRRIEFKHLRSFLQSVSFIAVFAVWPQASALTINPIFDVSITNDPEAATIEAEIISAISMFESIFSDPIIVTITFQEANDGLGGSSKDPVSLPYSAYRAALVSHATTADDAIALAYLPGGPNNPVSGGLNVILSRPLARALGFNANPQPGDTDGLISLNTSIMNLTRFSIDPNKYSLFAAVAHEIDEVLGLSSALNNLTNGAASPATGDAEDLFRYRQDGTRSFTTALNETCFFSLDGTTALAQFNQNQDGDFGDWCSCPGQAPQVQDAFASPAVTPVLDVELRALDAIGFNRGPPPVWVDFAYDGSPNLGTFNNPHKTLVVGANVIYSGGLVLMKGHRTSGEASPITLSKPMTLQAVGGSATIGQ